MAMGGGVKGHLHNNSGSRSSPSSGRSYYGWMLLLAFGVAIFGVMAIHKLRERRIFNLLVKEKDRELNTLQLLLQKEREYRKEAKLKLEEMKGKMRTLRIQKAELDGRILEMQSTISSLRDEQHTIELALEEKQNEMKLLRENYVDTEENKQAKALSEILKQKEAEIEDLKRHLELPAKVWSVSTDYPANSNINSTAKANTVNRDEANANQSKEESVKVYESTTGKHGSNSTQNAEIGRNESANNMNEESRAQGQSENVQAIYGRSEVIGEEQPKKLEDSQEGGLGYGSTKNGGIINQDSHNVKLNNEVQKPGHKEHGIHATVRNNELETAANDQQGKHSNSEMGHNQELGANYNGGMKSEMPENLHGGGSMVRGRGKLGYIRKIRGKRRRITAKSRVTTKNSIIVNPLGTRGTGFIRNAVENETDWKQRDEKPVLFGKDHDLDIDKSSSNESASVDQSSMAYNKLPQDGRLKSNTDEQVGLVHGKGQENLDENRSYNDKNDRGEHQQGMELDMHEKQEDAEHMKYEAANNSRPSHISVEQVPIDETINSENSNGTSKEAREQNPNHTEQPEEQDTAQPNEGSTEVDKADNSGQSELHEKDKDLDNPEMEDAEETETHTARGTKI